MAEKPDKKKEPATPEPVKKATKSKKSAAKQKSPAANKKSTGKPLPTEKVDAPEKKDAAPVEEREQQTDRSALYLGPAPYYGSEELTTALCVEALARYLQGTT